MKIAFNQDGIKQNNLEYKDNLEYNLVTPKIIQVFKIKNKTIAIECELVNTLEDFFNIDCLKHLRMDYKTFHILIEQLQKNIFDYNDFFIEIKNKQNSGKLNIYGKLFELNYTKEKFKIFCKSKWFNQLKNLLINKKIYLPELNGNNIGITKNGRIVILDSGK